MKLRILTSAFNDMTAGREFYERQGHGLGDYFLDSIFSDIDSLALYGGVHLKVFGYHRRLATRFPYAIYYRMGNSSEVIVHRVLDCSQNPVKTRIALKRSSS